MNTNALDEVYLFTYLSNYDRGQSMPAILNGTFNELLIHRYRGGEVCRYGQETDKVRNMYLEKG